MKKILFSIIIMGVLASCSFKQYDLDKMGEAVRSHLKYKDGENSTITKIDKLKAISYDEIPENERQHPDEVYLCKVYIRGTWSYDNSYRIYNIDDTLKCYFSKNKTFLRMDTNTGDK